MPFLVSKAKRRPCTKVTGDRTLDVACSSALTLDSVIELDAALELITWPASNDIDRAGVGISAEQRRLGAL